MSILVAGAVVGILYAIGTARGRLIFDHIRLKIPVWGDFVLQTSIVRSARGLSTLLSSGVPILEALDISKRLAGNKVVEQALDQAKKAVREGQGLGSQLASLRLFPPFMTQLISTGEATGKLSAFLDLLANFYEERIDAFLGRLATLVEPVILIVLGSIVGVIVVSMLIPIFQLSTGI